MKTQEENPDGLHQRYLIKKILGYRNITPFRRKAIVVEPDEKAEYFVMRLDEGGKDPNHIKACRIGIHAYADAIEATIPKLAQDLRERYPLLK